MHGQHLLHQAARTLAAVVSQQPDFRVDRRLDVFHRMDRFLVELLARAQAAVGYFNVLVRNKPGQLDHLAGQVRDFDRLPHIEDENFAALGLQRALQDQANRFGDAHEIARHLGMGHRERSAFGNLAAEDRHHASGRPQHVAETHRSVGASAPGRCLVFLDDHFCQALGCPHHAGGIDGFVGRNKDEFPRAVPPGETRDNLSPERIVKQSLARLRFHQRNVFVRGRMKNHRRPVRGK